MLKSAARKNRVCRHLVILGFLLLIAGCAGQHNGTRVQLNNDGTMVDSKTGLMWQVVRSEQLFSSGAEADAYASQLKLAGFDDWRLPTSQEFWDLYFANDYAMAGKLAKQVKMDRSYWTKDGNKILAGYLEDGDDPGINRYFLNTDKGYVRAVRSSR